MKDGWPQTFVDIRENETRVETRTFRTTTFSEVARGDQHSNGTGEKEMSREAGDKLEETGVAAAEGGRVSKPGRLRRTHFRSRG